MFTFKGLQQSSSIVNVTADGYFDTRAPLTANQTMTVFLIELGPAIVLTGQVTDAATSSPIPGATVDINGRYLTTTDSSGNYSLTGHLDQGGGTDVTHVYLIGYELFARYIRGMSSQSFRLYRIERITGGGSWLVTVRPDDSLCDNDLQDPQGANPGSGNVCRTVRVVAPSDGVLNLEAVSTGGVHPPLEVEVLGPPRTERIANPTSVRIAAGGEVEVSVEIPEGSTESQTFRLTTSMAGQ